LHHPLDLAILALSCLPRLALITKQEAAKRLNRHPSAVTKLVQDKELRTYILPGKKREMVDEDDVEKVRAFLQRGAKFTPFAHRKPDNPQSLKQIEPNGSALIMENNQQQERSKRKISEITEDDFSLFDDQGRPDAQSLRAWGEYEKSRTLQIQRLALEGEYVKVSEIKPAYDKAFATIKTGALAVPSQLKALHPEIPQEQLDSLEKLQRRMLDRAIMESTNGN